MSATVDAPSGSVFGRSNHAASLVIPRQTLVRRRTKPPIVVHGSASQGGDEQKIGAKQQIPPGDQCD
jgi:hypothetical protein